MARIFMDDVKRLCQETGVEYDEALALLRRAEGDYRRALRLYQAPFTVYVEPVSVEDAPRSRAQTAADRMRAAWNALRLRGPKLKTALAAALILAAVALIAAAPHVAGWTAALLALLRFCPVVRFRSAARAAC